MKKKAITVSDLLATLPQSACILGVKFHRRNGLLSGKVVTLLNNRFETFIIREGGAL